MRTVEIWDDPEREGWYLVVFHVDNVRQYILDVSFRSFQQAENYCFVQRMKGIITFENTFQSDYLGYTRCPSRLDTALVILPQVGLN